LLRATADGTYAEPFVESVTITTGRMRTPGRRYQRRGEVSCEVYAAPQTTNESPRRRAYFCWLRCRPGSLSAALVAEIKCPLTCLATTSPLSICHQDRD
jgi:hypothetical protein